MRPSPTRMPRAAWVIDLATLQEINGVSAVIGDGVGLEQVGRAHAVALEHDLAVLLHEQGQRDALVRRSPEDGVASCSSRSSVRAATASVIRPG